MEVCPCELLLVSFVQISGEKMKPKFKKVLHLFEELEEAGKSAIVTISLRKRIPPSSSCPKPQQQLKHPCHQHLGSAAAIEVQRNLLRHSHWLNSGAVGPRDHEKVDADSRVSRNTQRSESSS